MHVLSVLATLLCLCSCSVQAVKRGDFKTCVQSGFCTRNRALADRAAANPSQWSSPYTLSQLSAETASSYSASLHNQLFPNVSFELKLDFLSDGNARLRVDEVGGLHQRFNEAADWTLVSEPTLADKTSVKAKLGDKQSIFHYGTNQRLVLDHQPLKLTFERDGRPHVILNDRALFNMEHFRTKPAGDDDQAKLDDQTHEPQQQQTSSHPHFLSESQEGMWEERFGGHSDSKPKGPESLSLDIDFPGYEHVMGIPEHTGPLSLRTTRGGEGAYTDPYRLFNLDVFEYEADSEMALYGAIPFMQAHSAGSSVGVFWLNAAETWVDITKSTTKKKTTTSTHWISEAGILDLFVFLGPNPQHVIRDFTALVGRTDMPQYFAIGHHQCRWNYLNQEDVLEVSRRFDEEDMPMDVIWLDIEYAAEHRYFDWDKNNFPEPRDMLKGLEDRGRQLVAIVDPHIKRTNDFWVYKEAKDLDLFIKNKDGNDFEGICWTGSSTWIDFFDPKSWDWWIGQFKFTKWVDSARNLWIWNDMNEPAIFSGPEMTAPKDSKYNSGWENRDLHNLNGVLFHNLTAQALIEREGYARRPFVLSRSFWAGSQRFGAIWTGDNVGDWPHLASSSPSILANGIAGMAWSGADIGGFFGNPSPELLVRFYQAGVFHPFFRAHAHIDTKRREPYLFDEPIKSYLRNALKLRYSLLPALYTSFWDSHREGWPIAIPQYLMFPEDGAGIAVDDQYYLGHSGLLVKPIVGEGITQTEVYVPDEQPYYNYFTHDIHFGSKKGGSHFSVSAPLDTLPLFHRGGSILPRRDLVRRSAPLMWRDPITLVVALDSTHAAQGQLYLDDGDSYSFQQGELIWRSFNFTTTGKSFRFNNIDLAAATPADHLGLQSYSSSNKWAKHAEKVAVSDIIILGLPIQPTCITSSSVKGSIPFEWVDGASAAAGRRNSGKGASQLLIKHTSLPVTRDWQLDITVGGSTCEAQMEVHPAEVLQSPLCPPDHFRCENAGHIPSCLLLSRVNDGICDPECCDGTDEFDGKIQCGNRCKEVGEAYRKTKEEAARKARVGAKLRADYAAFGQKEKLAASKTVTSLSQELTELEAKEAALKRALEQAEAKSQEEIDRKKGSSLYRRIEDYHGALRSLRLDREQLQGELDLLMTILKDLKAGYNPNNQDMAVKGAVTGYTEFLASHGYRSTEEGADTADQQEQSSAPAAHEPQHDSVPDEDVQKLEGEDILALLDGSADVVLLGASDATAGLFRLEDYLPTALRQQYQALVGQVVTLLRTIGALPSSATGDADRPDVVQARQALNDAESKTRKTRKQLEDQQSVLDKDWGAQWEWKKLDGECLSKDTGEYTYEICLFGAAKQKPNRGGSNVNLGKYKGWRSGAPRGSVESYTQQIYDRGTKCWNGPERSVLLEIACGTKNELLSVMEMEKCEYQFKITSPAVCRDPAAEGQTDNMRDEL